MCYGCWQDAGFPYIVNDATRQAVDLIRKVDNYGNLHIVVDDWNMEDRCIEACRRDVLSAMDGKPAFGTCTHAEVLQAELACVNHLLSMTKDERYSAMAMVEGYTPELRARNNDLEKETGMIDPKEALAARWLAYREEFIPAGAGPDQKSALGYAYYSGMKGLMEVLHKISATEPMPNDVEITEFMNGLETALSEFYDAVCFPEEGPS